MYCIIVILYVPRHVVRVNKISIYLSIFFTLALFGHRIRLWNIIPCFGNVDSGDRLSKAVVLIENSFQENVVVVVCFFHDLKFCLSSQLKAASCARCSSEMPPSKQVNRHSLTTCLIVWDSPQSQSGEAM